MQTVVQRFQTARRTKVFASLIKLVSSSLAAQIITLVSTIFIARLYPVEAFGEFALLLAASQLAPILLSFRYEFMIMNVKSDNDALRIVLTCCLTSFVVSLLFLGTILVLDRFWSLPTLFSEHGLMLTLIISLVTLNNVFTKLLNRLQKYSVISLTLVLHSIVLNGSQIGLLLLLNDASSFTLVLGFFVATLSNFIMLFVCVVKHLDLSKPIPNIKQLLITFYSHRKFAIHNILNALLNKGTSEIPVFLFGAFFGTAAVGQYTLARRILNQPVTILGKNIGLLYHERIGKIVQQNKATAYKITSLTIVSLLVIMLPVCVIILLWGEMLFATVFGPEWQIAGVYAQLLLPLIVLKLLAAPVAHIYLVTFRTNELLWISVARIIFSVIGLILGSRLAGIEGAIFGFSIAVAAVHFTSLARAAYLAKMIDNKALLLK